MGIINTILSGELYKLRKYRIWRALFNDYKNNPLHPLQTYSIHKRGFTRGDWSILGLDKSNCSAYLSSKDYVRIHPLNGYYSKLIDDKVVIKYLFSGTALDRNMPEYYYLIDEDGILCPMMDGAKKQDLRMEDIYDLLREKKKLAVKLVTGSIGKGFYKAEYRDGKAFVNDKELTREEFCAFLPNCRNYIISEYLTTHPYLAEFWPSTANTMRFLVGRVGREWRMIKSFIRFGSKQTGSVENFNSGGILCYINEEGLFHGGYKIGYKGRKAYAIPVSEHVDTGKTLDGKIPCWDKVVEAANTIEALLPQTRYLGFDFVVTDKDEVKLLEINSLTSLDSIQLDGSILDTENGKWFFSSMGIG